MKLAAVLLACLAAAGCGPKRSEFAAFADEYFDAGNEWSPANATELGFHEFDSRLERRSARDHQQRIATLWSQWNRLQTMRKGPLHPDDAIDADLIASAIQAELFELETLETWRKNPMSYVSLPGSAVDSLMKRNFAPAEARLRSVNRRLREIPDLLAAMRENVRNPPKEFTDIAVRIAGGSSGFFRNDVAQWAKVSAGTDTALLNEFSVANQKVVEALEAATDWLKNDLLPRSQGSYAIGADAYAKKLLYEEMVDLPLDRLLAIGESTLERDYQALRKTAAEIDPKRPPAEVIKSMADDHPTAANLVESCRRTIEEARRFVVDKKIVAIPSEVRPVIAETPAYARSGSFASMSTPGPFELRATEAYYYVTPPEKDWTPKQVEEHLRAYNPPVMRIITVHEAYPGHYLQFLYGPRFPTKTRKVLACGSNAEGWAHYAEQMAIEEGFGGGDPKVRLAQLQEALVRDCRYVAGIKLHTQGWTVEQATQLFLDKTLHERQVAFEEARRGTYNPTYLYYTLGKLMIYKLRDDYKRHKGSAYSLQDFHGAFVAQGSIPLKIVRRMLIPGDTSPLL